LAVIEVAFNWGDPSWWPFIVVDYVAVALLVAGAHWSPRVLAAGWGFACAMFYMAFFVAAQEPGTPRPLLAGMGAMFGLTVVGLGLSLVGAGKPRNSGSRSEP
jgi:hypothetical protein